MESSAEQKKSGPSYYLIWLILAVLTVVEVGIAYISGLPRTVLILILVGLAIWKATLVALYYMHLRFERLRLIARVADAVAFAHAHGVVHRDLSPANIMVRTFGEVLVVDWGLAQVAAARQAGGAPVVAGTPGFIAPEQPDGRGA